MLRLLSRFFLPGAPVALPSPQTQLFPLQLSPSQFSLQQTITPSSRGLKACLMASERDFDGAAAAPPSCQGCRVVTHAVNHLASSLPRGERRGSARECAGDLRGPLRRWLPWRRALGAVRIHNGRERGERGSDPEGRVLQEQLSQLRGGGGSKVATSGTASRAVTLLDLAG